MKEKMDFEEALEQLEKKVEILSTGRLPLKEALRNFEEGIELFKLCSTQLKEAEQKVRKLVETAEGLTQEPFSLD